MRVIQACWEDITAGFAEAAKLRAQIRAKHGADLDEARRRWVGQEAALRRAAVQRARIRLLLFPLKLALVLGAGAGLLLWADAAVRSGAPAWLAGMVGKSPLPAWLLGPGRPGLRVLATTLGLVWGVRVFDAWRKATARRWVELAECPYPDGDLSARLWGELGRWPGGMEGLRETEGSEGERALISLLQKKLSDEYVGLVGPLVAEALDVDLLVLGPTGIWVLDSKFHRGRVEYVGGQFIKTKAMGVRTVEKEFDLVRSMEREVEGVGLAMDAAGQGRLKSHLHAAVVFTHPEVRLHTQGAPFPCLLPPKVPAVILAGPRTRGLSPAVLPIVDAIAKQAKRLATRESDLVKVSARGWIREQARYYEDEVIDCLQRERQEEAPRAGRRPRRRGPRRR